MSDLSSFILEVKTVTHGGGHEVLYRPLNSLARSFAGLLRQKTLTPIDIEKIKEIGFRVEVTHD